jgi:hypothetical protein
VIAKLKEATTEFVQELHQQHIVELKKGLVFANQSIEDAKDYTGKVAEETMAEINALEDKTMKSITGVSRHLPSSRMSNHPHTTDLIYTYTHTQTVHTHSMADSTASTPRAQHAHWSACPRVRPRQVEKKLKKQKLMTNKKLRNFDVMQREHAFFKAIFAQHVRMRVCVSRRGMGGSCCWRGRAHALGKADGASASANLYPCLQHVPVTYTDAGVL